MLHHMQRDRETREHPQLKESLSFRPKRHKPLSSVKNYYYDLYVCHETEAFREFE